jgi:hypothetical protein
MGGEVRMISLKVKGKSLKEVTEFEHVLRKMIKHKIAVESNVILSDDDQFVVKYKINDNSDSDRSIELDITSFTVFKESTSKMYKLR